MPLLEIFGYSDDLIQFDGSIVEEFPVGSSLWTAILVAPNGETATVHAIYAGVEGSEELFALHDLEDEGVSWLVWLDGAPESWKYVFSPVSEHVRYSTGVAVDAPVGTVILVEEDQ